MISDIRFNEKLIGCLLGDASISKEIGKQNNRFSIIQTERNYDLIDDVKNELIRYGFNSTIMKRNSQFSQNSLFQLQSSRNIVFTQMRKFWYPNNFKRIMPELKLTPIILAYWFMCDGSTSWRNDMVMLQLSTDGFLKYDVLLLINKLKDLELNFTVTCDVKRNLYKIVSFKSSEVIKFLDLVRPFILDCFKYKIKYPLVTSYKTAFLKRRRDPFGRFC